MVINKTTEWSDKKSISVETREYIKSLEDRLSKSSNSYEKAMYVRMIQEEEDGICSRCHRTYDKTK